MAPLNEHKTREKKEYLAYLVIPCSYFSKKSRWDTHPASPHPFKKVPETFLSSFIYHPEMVFSFSLKQWAKVLSAVTKKSAIFVQLLLKSPQICEFLTACSANLKKCVSTVITKLVVKNGRFIYRLHTALLRILKVSLTLLAVWGNDLNKILALDNELGGLFCLIIPIPFSNWQGWACAFLCVVRVKKLDI